MSKEGLKIEGFSRVRIMENGKIKGDSGWCGPNQLTNDGIRMFLCARLGTESGSLNVTHAGLGTGSAPASNATALVGAVSGTGNVVIRAAVAAASDASTTEVFTATFASSNKFVTTSENISCVGLFGHSSSAATVFAGNTYASSTCATNQDVHSSYEIRFSTSA